MPRSNLTTLSDCSITERAEVLFALAKLVDEVAHLAFNVKRIVSKFDARRKGGEPKTTLRSHTPPNAMAHSRLRPTLWPTPSDAAGDIQAVEMTKTANFPLSPHWDEATLAKSKDGRCQAENVIAARIAELHDKLGGFIMPSPPHLRDRNT